MTTHTPGPWETDQIEEGDQYRYVVAAAKPFPHVIARCELGTRGGEANARLIASAPDLLAALRWIIERHDAGLHFHDASLAKARDAVAKAEGRT